MKNRLLYITRRNIPYIKELRRSAGSVTGCILMQQLEYWFAIKGAYFYKFLKPCDHEKYRKGDSWAEELGISDDEFRTAFSKIGITYKSKTDFQKAREENRIFIKNGTEVMYCCIIDRVQHISYYIRNNQLVDNVLDSIVYEVPISGNPQGQFPETNKEDLRNSTPPGSNISESTYQETTSEFKDFLFTPPTDEVTSTSNHAHTRDPERDDESKYFRMDDGKEYHKRELNQVFFEQLKKPLKIVSGAITGIFLTMDDIALIHYLDIEKYIAKNREFLQEFQDYYHVVNMVKWDKYKEYQDAPLPEEPGDFD